jgi:2-oxoglutarate ferredoxin oxidoreductase subunit beta
MFDDPHAVGHFPRPFGVFYAGSRPTYEEEMNLQIEEAIAVRGQGNLDALLQGKETWVITE